MSKTLPPEKILKLGDDLAKDLHKTMKEHYDRARQHEVTKEDAQVIVTGGWDKAGKISFSDLDSNAPSKPRP